VSPVRRWRICGVDFTSRPRARKPITIASGRLVAGGFMLDTLEACDDWPGFEAWLRREGPWIAGFDFPFGLPRSAVLDLGWPTTWEGVVRHCAAMGREAFRAALDGHREQRPAGNRYAHRAADLPAKSHSPLKLVNPPVALMFLEGSIRLLEAGVSIPGMRDGDPRRLAFEAYPGYCARLLGAGSYKNDATARQTPARRKARALMVRKLASSDNPFGFALQAPAALSRSLVADATGDRLDAVLCAMQAAWAWRRRGRNYGLPGSIDPLEGWILMVPEPKPGK
jgi:hypothetical protein